MNLLTRWRGCFTRIRIWRSASSTIFSWPGTRCLPPVSKFEETHTHGLTFSTDDELKYATEEWLKEQSELFYFAGVEKLRDRCTLCIDKGGDQRLSIRGLPFKIRKNSFLHISIERKAINVPFAHNTRIDILWHTCTSRPILALMSDITLFV